MHSSQSVIVPAVEYDFAEIGGIRVFCRCNGAREPSVLLLLHGTQLLSYASQPHAAAGAQVSSIAPEFPCVGFTDVPGSR